MGYLDEKWTYVWNIGLIPLRIREGVLTIRNIYYRVNCVNRDSVSEPPHLNNDDLRHFRYRERAKFLSHAVGGAAAGSCDIVFFYNTAAVIDRTGRPRLGPI